MVGFRQLSPREALALLAGDRELCARVGAGEQFRVPTPLRYPGRRGQIVLYLTPGASSGSGGRSVRISEGGELIQALDEQGLDLETDLVLSKTVYHAVQEVPGAGLGGGQIYLETDVDRLPPDLWRFLQLLTEILGLRHAKYKDALIQLSRRQEAQLPGPPD